MKEKNMIIGCKGLTKFQSRELIEEIVLNYPSAEY